MSAFIGMDFFHLAQRHSNAVMDVTALRGGHSRNLAGSSALAEAVATERTLRQALIDWKPASNIEAQTKLLYMVQYLFATRSSLRDDEMTSILNSIAHLSTK
ncbi:hypothetical protein [Agrobacterium fabrum]|uniref:hypothetical protein n=1 Tax=Agrobacterium fabrum TaxID=1176649 RepID=UPI003BA289B5